MLNMWEDLAFLRTVYMRQDQVKHFADTVVVCDCSLNLYYSTLVMGHTNLEIRISVGVHRCFAAP